MKIRILEKCKIGGLTVNPGDIVDASEAEALSLEAHGHAEFAAEAVTPLEDEQEVETDEKKHAEHKAPAHKKAKSHNG